MKIRDIFQYHHAHTLVHRIDPRAKLIWGIVLSLLVMLLGHPVLLGGLFLIALFPWFVARPPLRKFRMLFVLFIVVLVGTMITQGVFYYWRPRTVLLTLVPGNFPILGRMTGGLHLYREGLVYGAIQSLRFLSAITTGMLIIITTHPSDLLLGATRLKVPPKFAFMLTVALRFLPLMIEETKRILVAQQVRGLRLKGFRGKMRGFRLALIPLVIGALRRARQLALAAEVRAFHGERTSMHVLTFTGKDWFVVFLAIGLLGGGILAVLCGYGAEPAGIHE
ncbi:MAG: energy-coupling factor transporter transmembrane component T [Candidatus Latescibacterota bacterium]